MKYEIHITVELEKKTVEDFKKICRILRVKPIIIETGDYKQVMTSSIYSIERETDAKRAIELTNHLDYLSKMLGEYGFYVVRQKVEIQPAIVKHANHKYYESHIRVKYKKLDKEVLETISGICEEFELHKSKNLFKSDETHNYQMLTYRTYSDTIWEFGTHIEDAKDHLEGSGVEFDKVELEECIYDSNSEIDKKWLND